MPTSSLPERETSLHLLPDSASNVPGNGWRDPLWFSNTINTVDELARQFCEEGFGEAVVIGVRAHPDYDPYCASPLEQIDARAQNEFWVLCQESWYSVESLRSAGEPDEPEDYPGVSARFVEEEYSFVLRTAAVLEAGIPRQRTLRDVEPLVRPMLKEHLGWRSTVGTGLEQKDREAALERLTEDALPSALSALTPGKLFCLFACVNLQGSPHVEMCMTESGFSWLWGTLPVAVMPRPYEAFKELLQRLQVEAILDRPAPRLDPDPTPESGHAPSGRLDLKRVLHDHWKKSRTRFTTINQWLDGVTLSEVLTKTEMERIIDSVSKADKKREMKKPTEAA
jgi:hypothetical protein